MRQGQTAEISQRDDCQEAGSHNKRQYKKSHLMDGEALTEMESMVKSKYCGGSKQFSLNKSLSHLQNIRVGMFCSHLAKSRPRAQELGVGWEGGVWELSARERTGTALGIITPSAATLLRAGRCAGHGTTSFHIYSVWVCIHTVDP